MRHDTQRRRSARPRLMTNLTTGERLDHEVEFIVTRGLLRAAAQALSQSARCGGDCRAI